MKPKDLRFTFLGDRYFPFIEERILCLPKDASLSISVPPEEPVFILAEHTILSSPVDSSHFGLSPFFRWNGALFSFPGWNHPLFFPRSLPLHVEYCSGNGAWIVAKAQESPHLNWIAVEKKLDRVRKIWSKIRNLGMTNVWIVWGEAHQFSQMFLKSSSVDAIYVNFPDPWPKTRHTKNRLMQPEFSKEMERVLREKGRLFFVSDDEAYTKSASRLLIQQKSLTPFFSYPHYYCDYPHYGSSYFEEFWKSQGRQIHYQEWIKHDAT